MNITQILLGFTAALLFGAIVLSYSDMKVGEQQYGLQQDAEKIMLDNAHLQAELDRLRGGAVVMAPELEVEVPEEVDTAMIEQMKQEQELLRQQLADEAAMRAQAEAEAMALAESEPKRVNGRLDKDGRRARNISMAMLMAEVIEIAEQGDISIIVLGVKRPERVQMNTELAIRRGSKIIGRLVVSNIVSGNVFADPISSTFPEGAIDVKVGDELIIPPIF